MRDSHKMLLDDIRNNGLDMNVFKLLLKTQAEVIRRFASSHGNQNTLRLWRHLTERFGDADGFRYNPAAFPAPWLAVELQRLVDMDLVEYEGDGKYFWKPVELPEVGSEDTVSQAE